MNFTTTVQPLNERPKTAVKDKTNQLKVSLVKNGADKSEAQKLVTRVTGGHAPADKFEEASLKAFIASIAALSDGGRLTSVG